MSGDVPLPLIMPAMPQQRWSCHSCGACCRSLVAHLFETDRQRIDEQGWRDELGVSPYVRAGNSYVLNKRRDGDDEVCVFLDDHNRCRIHSRYGEEAKPLACRIFPFSVTEIDGEWQASLRFDCPSVTGSKGEPTADKERWLRGLTRELPPVANRRTVRPRLGRRIRATREEEDIITQRFVDWFSTASTAAPAVHHRLIAAARLTLDLGQIRFDKVRGSRLGELLDLLIGGSAGGVDPLPDHCTARQRAMSRQLAFVHAEHVSLASLRGGAMRRFALRFDQLRRGAIFRKGKGVVPFLPGCGPGQAVRFEQVERMLPDPEDASRTAELLTRYVVARLAGRTVFGAGYYGRSVAGGLSALWLSITSVGWIARYLCARRNAEAFSFDDVASALGVVDRAATRLPALGTTAERARERFFQENDGLPRAVRALSPLPDVRPGDESAREGAE